MIWGVFHPYFWFNAQIVALDFQGVYSLPDRQSLSRLQRLEALWDRPSYRMRRFNLTVEAGGCVDVVGTVGGSLHWCSGDNMGGKF